MAVRPAGLKAARKGRAELVAPPSLADAPAPEVNVLSQPPDAEGAPQSQAEAMREIAQLTPMMRQYLETKALHPDAILFFRLGDFYEMFFEDAVRAAELLQITLTSRAKGADRVPMCGVPYHAARRYIARLIEFGLKVAICEQVEEATDGPGIVRREVVRVITPGMVLDEEVLEQSEPNFLAAVSAGEDSYGLSLLEASTGEFLCMQLPAIEAVAEELGRVSARELLVCQGEQHSGWLSSLQSLLSKKISIATAEPAAFSRGRGEALLRAHFSTASLDGFGLADCDLAVGAAGAALRYLKETQRTDARHIDRIRRVEPGQRLRLDESSLVNLEVTRTLKDGSRRGALLGVLDKTATGMGARKLRAWLCAPLMQVEEIKARLTAVEELSHKSVWREELSGTLKQIADLERLSGRLSLGAGNARDMLALARSLAVLPLVGARLSQCESPLLSSLAGPLLSLRKLEAELLPALADEPPVTLKEGGLLKAGYHAELDRLIKLSTSGKDVLLQIEQRERERTGIHSLKVRFNKVFGYYLEVTRSNLHLVPKDYQRKQTTVGAERYVTDELKQYEEQVLTAEEKRCALEFELFEALRQKVISCAPAIRAVADAVATADALVSFARCAAEYGYCRPEVDESEVTEIIGGRHPVVERMLASDVFVPNDVRLSREDSQVLVITGPNMAGKSTVMRQVALITLMAQAGSFVPAQRARLGVCDRIFTRVGAADNLARGQSTFMVEMTETSNILHHATAKSLVVLDEIGRGTSTFDGLSIAWAVAEHLHDQIGARTLFATHYHELTDLAVEKPRVKNCAIAVKEVSGKVVFLRKLVVGAANKSYGIEVARLAGLPTEVVGRARQILANLESGELDESGHPRLVARPQSAPGPSAQLGLFVADGPPALSAKQKKLLTELSELDLNTTTPLEALNLLAKWKKSL